MRLQIILASVSLLVCGVIATGCGDESDDGDSSSTGTPTPRETCEASGFKGSCAGTLCNDYYGDVDVTALQSNCGGIHWTWSTQPCSGGLDSGFCLIGLESGCQVQSYYRVGDGPPLCEAYGGEYTPPPE